jgi:hypothetical protein
VLPTNGPADTDPERHYWFDFGCARFIAIDTDVDEDELRDKVAPWLAQVSKSAGTRWRFVSLHHPIHTGSTYRPPVKHVRKILAPVVEAAGVDVVFAGHNHLYERSKPILAGNVVGDDQGVIHIVTGAGSARLRPAKHSSRWPDHVATAYSKDYSFTIVEVAADGLKLQQINRKNKVVDRWTLGRPPRHTLKTMLPR